MEQLGEVGLEAGGKLAGLGQVGPGRTERLLDTQFPTFFLVPSYSYDLFGKYISQHLHRFYLLYNFVKIALRCCTSPAV